MEISASGNIRNANNGTENEHFVVKKCVDHSIPELTNDELEALKPTVEPFFFYEKVLGAPVSALAPMVDGSDLPYRLLCRNHGVCMCWTPMYNVNTVVSDSFLRRGMLQELVVEREYASKNIMSSTSTSTQGENECKCSPSNNKHRKSQRNNITVLQFAGNQPDRFVEAVKSLETLYKELFPNEKDLPYDALCLNFGCPASVASRGYYGAYLMDNWPLVHHIIKKTRLTSFVPIFAKTRPLTSTTNNSAFDINETRSFARMIRDSGASLLTIHGRHRNCRGGGYGACTSLSVPADWEIIHEVVDEVGKSIPVVANGGVWNRDIHNKCLEVSGAVATMSGVGLLEDAGMYETSDEHTAYLTLPYALITPDNKDGLSVLSWEKISSLLHVLADPAVLRKALHNPENPKTGEASHIKFHFTHPAFTVLNEIKTHEQQIDSSSNLVKCVVNENVDAKLNPKPVFMEEEDGMKKLILPIYDNIERRLRRIYQVVEYAEICEVLTSEEFYSGSSASDKLKAFAKMKGFDVSSYVPNVGHVMRLFGRDFMAGEVDMRALVTTPSRNYLIEKAKIVATELLWRLKHNIASF